MRDVDVEQAQCSVCETEFEVRFSYQRQRTDTGLRYYCNQKCHEHALFSHTHQTCSTCTKPFELQFAYQQAIVGGMQVYFCSLECRDQPIRREKRKRQGATKIAVMNQKGGTGKTTTTVNLAFGLARVGHKVLVVDVDSQGNVGVSMGVEAEKNLYDVLVGQSVAEEVIVSVADNVDLIAADVRLASLEAYLASALKSERVMKKGLAGLNGYDFIILDCGPSTSLLNQNALIFADWILIPVSCDYLSLVGVKQILATLKQVQSQWNHPVTVLGVLPTFFDVRNRISHEVVRTLKRYFKDKVLPPIRINTRLKEAPAKKKSIFAFAPRSHGAQDYETLVETIEARLKSKSVPAPMTSEPFLPGPVAS